MTFPNVAFYNMSKRSKTHTKIQNTISTYLIASYHITDYQHMPTNKQWEVDKNVFLDMF